MNATLEAKVSLFSNTFAARSNFSSWRIGVAEALERLRGGSY